MNIEFRMDPKDEIKKGWEQFKGSCLYGQDESGTKFTIWLENVHIYQLIDELLYRSEKEALKDLPRFRRWKEQCHKEGAVEAINRLERAGLVTSDGEPTPPYRHLAAGESDVRKD